MAAKDYYRTLGVSERATADEIKRAYRTLAKQLHPDANPDDAKAGERFKDVSEAYATLSDPEKRRQYDTMRRLGAFDGSAARRPSRGGSGAAAGAPPGSDEGSDFSFGDLGLGDIFSSIFGARGRAQQAPEAVEVTVEVPFRTAALGGQVTVTLPIDDDCPDCRGSGAAPGATLATCAECGGRGTVSFGQGGFAVNRPCPRCRGRGKTASAPCPRCRGAGRLRQERAVAVTIAAGTEAGQRIRLKGAAGGSADLLVTVQVAADRFFRRDGLDLVCEVPINLAQATLGTKLRVRTIDGRKVALRIAPGTQPGRRLRLKGMGLAKGGRQGDQIVVVRVTVPEQLTEEQRALLERFAAAAGLAY